MVRNENTGKQAKGQKYVELMLSTHNPLGKSEKLDQNYYGEKG